MLRPINPRDRERLADLLVADWGSTLMVSRGRLLDVVQHQGFIAEENGEWLGYVTYQVGDEDIEVTVLQALKPGYGVGSALLAACVAVARDRKMPRIVLITTNDNDAALDFYRRRGWHVTSIRREAITQARLTLKPEIPLIGNNGIPIRDEIELELPRSEWDGFIARYGW